MAETCVCVDSAVERERERDGITARVLGFLRVALFRAKPLLKNRTLFNLMD